MLAERLFGNQSLEITAVGKEKTPPEKLGASVSASLCLSVFLISCAAGVLPTVGTQVAKSTLVRDVLGSFLNVKFVFFKNL